MCYGCWDEAGKPSAVTPAIEASAALVKRLYDKFSCVGGNLHIVTDDWNLENGDLAFCRDQVNDVQQGQPGKYADTSPFQVELETSILDAMEAMSEQERYVVLALADGFIDRSGTEVS